jgi:hypothetical protein
MSIVKAIPETLSAFSPKLRADLKLNVEKEFESFLLYLDLCSCMFTNKHSMREVLNLILKVNDDHVKELVNSTYPILMSSEKSTEYSEARNNFNKNSNQSAADRMNKTCNKILDFLSDINRKTIVYNPEYILLQSSTNAQIAQRKETLEAWIRDLPKDEGFQELLEPKALRAEKLFLDVIHYRNGVKDVCDQVIHVVEALSERNDVVDLTEDDVDEVLQESDFVPSLNENQKKRTLALVVKYKSEILNESHSTDNLQEVSIIRASERITRKPISYSSRLLRNPMNSAVSKRKQTPMVQIGKTSAVSKRKAPNQIVQQIAKTVRVNRRGNICSKSEAAVASIVDGTGEAEADAEAAGQKMDLAVRSSQEEEATRTSFHAISREGDASLQNLSHTRQNNRRKSIFLSKADAEVDAEEKEEEVISSSIVVGTREEAEAEEERTKTSFHDSSRECATRDDEAEGDRAEVKAGQMSRVDEASVLKPPPSVSDTDAHLCLMLDSFTTQLMDWDLNDEDLLLFGQRIISFVEDNIDVNSFTEFLQSFLLEDDSISRIQLVSTTSSLPNDRISPSQLSFKSQTLSTILEEPDYSLLNTLGRPWKEGNSIGSGITRVTGDEQFSYSLNYDIIATCLVRAFVQLSLPTENKHPRWIEIGNCLKYCLPKVYQESDALDNIWVHISPEMLGIISSMHLQLGGGGVKLTSKPRSRRGDNALLQNQKTSDFQQTIQKLISEWLVLNPDLSDRGEGPSIFFKKHVLISVSVEPPIPSSHEQIPLSFPVVLFGKTVVLQTFAASYTSNSPYIPDPHLKIISRTTSEYNYGKYFLVDSDGIVKKDDITIEGTCQCNSGDYSLNRLFFIESCSQPSVSIQYTLNEEILFFSQGFDLRGSDLEKFVSNDEDWIEAGIIAAFMDRISSAFVDHPRFQFNIFLPLDFDLAVLVNQLSEEEALAYLERVLGAYELDENTIIHLVVNVNFMHWIYCAAVFSNSTIYLCDSLSKKLTNTGEPKIDTDPVYINLCKVLGMEFQRRRRASMEWNK